MFNSTLDEAVIVISVICDRKPTPNKPFQYCQMAKLGIGFARNNQCPLIAHLGAVRTRFVATRLGLMKVVMT